jgi:hypothetical protein
MRNGNIPSSLLGNFILNLAVSGTRTVHKRNRISFQFHSLSVIGGLMASAN